MGGGGGHERFEAGRPDLGLPALKLPSKDYNGLTCFTSRYRYPQAALMELRLASISQIEVATESTFEVTGNNACGFRCWCGCSPRGESEGPEVGKRWVPSHAS